MMLREWSRRFLGGRLFVLLLGVSTTAAISVKLKEVLDVHEATARGEFQDLGLYAIDTFYGGISPIGTDCAGGQCIGMFTRDESLELNSKYGCTEPEAVSYSDDFCGVTYNIGGTTEDSSIAAVHIAFHPDSVRTVRVLVDEDVVVEEWEASAGTEFQAIPGIEGAMGNDLTIEGVLEGGEYLGILEVEIFMDVDEVEIVGVSASSRVNISAMATTDGASVMYILDGNALDEFSWTCLSGEVCEITFDFGIVEALEQVRIGFLDSTEDGDEFAVFAAGESGVFFPVRTGIKAGGRPAAIDGLQTFGGLRALARYVKMVVTPATGGSIAMNEIEFRVGEDAAARAVAEKPWLKPTGPLPAGRVSEDGFPAFDARPASEGGCDSPGVFDGCHIFYIKDGDMSKDSRWSCGPTVWGDSTTSNWPFYGGELCAVEFDLNVYRYVRQIQIAFHFGDEQHYEFAIQAYTKNYEWATVVPSVISSDNSTSLQTFDAPVHTDVLRLVPKFQSVNQMVNIKEIVILEKKKEDFEEGTVPVFYLNDNSFVDTENPEATRRFAFDIPEAGDEYQIVFAEAIVSGLRMKFPKDRAFTFNVKLRGPRSTISQIFTSAGGEKTFETFLLPRRAISYIDIEAVEGPTFEQKPWYPTLRVVDFQIIGEVIKTPGTFVMASTAMLKWSYYNGDGGWGRIPDIIAEASADQELIMATICETKGAAYDGTDCVGELDDTPVTITMPPVSSTTGFFVNGPIFLKSGVTLRGGFNVEFSDWTDFWVYDGPNISNTGEDAVIVVDNATDVLVETIYFRGWWQGAPGSIIPSTVGNLFLEARHSQGVTFDFCRSESTRSGAARFSDSRNISVLTFWNGGHETGIFLELNRVDDFYFFSPPWTPSWKIGGSVSKDKIQLSSVENERTDDAGWDGRACLIGPNSEEMSGLMIDTCTNATFEGLDQDEWPKPGLYPPMEGNQTSNVFITEGSSEILFSSMPIGPGSEPRILTESMEPMTLEEVTEYVEAEPGDCIVQVPEGSTEETLIQINSDQTLTKSGNCWVL